MMKKIKESRLPLLLAFLLLIFFYSCEPKWKEVDLHGTWRLHSWVEKSSGESVGDKMDFTFGSDEDKRYTIDYGSLQEIGKYWIEYDYLVTVEDGSVAKKVKLISMSEDTLKFDMNRAGTLERLVLLRVK